MDPNSPQHGQPSTPPPPGPPSAGPPAGPPPQAPWPQPGNHPGAPPQSAWPQGGGAAGWPTPGPPPPRKGISTGIVIGIVIAAVALLAVCGGIGIGGYLIYTNAESEPATGSTAIDGLVDYRQTDPASLTQNHQTGRIEYRVNPPAGGDHNTAWQNCEGDVYDTQIPSEHAVHSLEHGAVWVTYRPDLPKDQINELAAKVRGRDYLLMSPYPGLDKPISLQAWGYQLKVDEASDADIDKFITAYRRTATKEPGAICGTGVRVTGSEPQG